LVLLDHGQVDAAVQHLEVGLWLRSRADRRGQALSALALGAAYLRAGERDVAHRHLNRAVNQFDILGDVRGMAAALNNLGVVLSEQGDRMGAAERWDMARAYYVRLADELGLSSVLLNIAAELLATDRERTAEAADLLTESLRLRGARPETRSAGLAHLYLGDALAMGGKSAQAKEHWQAAAEILIPLGGADGAVASRRLTPG
jgi:tetratricopeptide (TPR) repeat protein